LFSLADRSSPNLQPDNLILAKDLGYGETAVLHNILEEVSRMLNAYASAILTSGS
jgi:hypothetical protein